MPIRTRLPILLFGVLALAWPGSSAWAVATLTGLATTMTGDPLPSATVVLESEMGEQDGKKVPPVVVLTDSSGHFKAENLMPGTYHLTTVASGTHASEWVELRDGEQVDRSLSPSSDPENPGAGNLGLGVGYWGMWRSLHITRDVVTATNGVQTVTKSFDTGQLNRENKFDLDTNVGFAQVGYGLPDVGLSFRGGYLNLGTTVYGRLGAGTSRLTLKSPDDTAHDESGASPFVGGGINAKLVHSAWPVYFLFGFEWYYLNLVGVQAHESSPAGLQNTEAEGNQWGWGINAEIGAQIGRLVTGLPAWLALTQVYAGMGGSWVNLDVTLRQSGTSCSTVPGKPLGPFPDSPRAPDQTICSSQDETKKRSFGEASAIHGRVGVTAPLLWRSNGMVQADFGGDWWSFLVKVAVPFGP